MDHVEWLFYMKPIETTSKSLTRLIVGNICNPRRPGNPLDLPQYQLSTEFGHTATEEKPSVVKHTIFWKPYRSGQEYEF